MPAPQKIINLLENFDRNIDELKRAQNETQVRTQLERQIAHSDNEIDRPVYELYGLSEEEINVVGG